MKKSHELIIRLASRFQTKLAQSQTLQQIIQNAAGSGEQSANGIMNFPVQLKKDQADLSINVTIKPATFGGENVEVSAPTVDPPQFAQNYARLPEQIKKYLERYIKDFPQVPRDTPITLSYSGKNTDSGIAQN